MNIKTDPKREIYSDRLRMSSSASLSLIIKLALFLPLFLFPRWPECVCVSLSELWCECMSDVMYVLQAQACLGRVRCSLVQVSRGPRENGLHSDQVRD